ncbi:MAG TPA: DUF1848 domain-containing protein [Clostridiaceae bacterium]|nr:DUF1848 domain-containing protein [Clostridiaceae bacterium]
MARHKWDTVYIETEEGIKEGVAPVIISASRATDIPAFYSEWLLNRLNKGYIKWINPFNSKPQYVSFSKARVFVFWTKDAQSLIPYLEEFDNRGINYYFLFTVNDYEKEGLEPALRSLDDRIETFRELSDRIGRNKVIWRFDPLILTDEITVDKLLEKVYKVGSRLSDYTEKLVISFADISAYRKVQSNLRKNKVNYIEFNPETMEETAKGLQEINKQWGIEIATCAEDMDLGRYGIRKNRCIDDELMIRLFPHDRVLMDFLNRGDYAEDRAKKLKDKGQREHCGCIVSKDIGQYNTCCHQCVYCYANSSPQTARSNYQKYLAADKDGESAIHL